MRLYIDDILIYDYDSYPDVGITLDNDSIEDIDSLKTSRTTTLEVPITPLTRRVFGHADNPHSQRFNNSLHMARLEEDSIVICEGFAYLSSINEGFGLNIIGAGKAWAVWAANHKLSQITGYSLLMQDIETAWAGNNPIQMFHVQRQEIEEMGIKDLHPFFNVKTFFTKIFSDAGYSLVTSLPDDIYFSDKVLEQDEKKIIANTGFKATRLPVSSTPAFPAIRDIITDLDFSLVDNTVKDGYFNNGGFSLVGNMPTFTNKHSMAVSVYFKLEMSFNTQIKYSGSMGTERVPAYFNKFTYGGVTREFEYSATGIEVELIKRLYNNLNYDNWIYETGIGGESFFSIRIEDSNPSDSYFLRAYKYNAYNNTWGWYIPNNLIHEFSIPASDIGIEKIYNVEGEDISNLSFVVFKVTGGVYSPVYTDTGFELFIKQYTDNEEYISFDVDIESINPQFLNINESCACGEFEFSQDNKHQAITLVVEDVSLEMLCAPILVGEGGVMDASIGLSETTQIDFIKAIKHIYNLRFLTDEDKKIVYAYPRPSFYSNTVFDWSGKIDKSTPIEITEIGQDIGSRFILSYQDADSHVQAYNESSPILGRYETTLLHKYTGEEYENENPLFSSSIIDISSLGHPILYVDNEGNFSPRIVKYLGKQSTSNSKLYPSSVSYPLLNFTSIGFDTMNYYTENVQSYNYGRRISVYLDLKTKDIEGFVRLNSIGRDFRAIYLILVDNEKVPCRIERIENYIPGKSTLCTFITI